MEDDLTDRRRIRGAPTSVTAFVGRASRGPVDSPIPIRSFGAFTREFGGLSGPMSYAVHQFFEAGGFEALIVRVANAAHIGDVPPRSGDGPITDIDIATGPTLKADGRGIYALDKTESFNLLVIPPYSFDDDVGPNAWEAARIYCRNRRAMLLIDPPSHWRSAAEAAAEIDAFRGMADENAALYFPRVQMSDPLQEGRPRAFAPSGLIAGLYARTDAERGVWKAPAGRSAALPGVQGVTVELSDDENGLLNPLAVNCLRTIPGAGFVVWGARTLAGIRPSDWRYVNVRRLALYIEESLHRGMEWAAFESNDEQLWTRLRESAGAFLHDLFRRGAFQGSAPHEAYFVKCDGQTTTQNDIDRGIINVVVGIAPLKPAEFVVLRIRAKTGGRR